MSALPQQTSSSSSLGQNAPKIENSQIQQKSFSTSSATNIETTNNNSNNPLINGLSNKYNKPTLLDDGGRYNQQEIFNQQRYLSYGDF